MIINSNNFTVYCKDDIVIKLSPCLCGWIESTFYVYLPFILHQFVTRVVRRMSSRKRSSNDMLQAKQSLEWHPASCHDPQQYSATFHLGRKNSRSIDYLVLLDFLSAPFWRLHYCLSPGDDYIACVYLKGRNIVKRKSLFSSTILKKVYYH